MQTILRYWHTLKYLKPVQIYGRILFRIARPRPDLSPAPSVRNINLAAWKKPAERRQSMLGPETFCFLNETYALPEVGWDNSELPKLWRYNLHYFDDLNASGARERRQWHKDLISLWLKENPPGLGTGWEPYPVSLRVVNWIKWALSGQKLCEEAIESLAVQARWLMKRLEIHLLGNHLLSNGKALIFSGLFFKGREAQRWLAKGLDILERQLSAQILDDGGHFELSTMYHVLALEDVLDLYNIIQASNMWSGHLADFHSRLAKVAAKMVEWMDVMCHPDGEISFFNDAALGIALSPCQIKEYAKRLGIELPKRREGIVDLRDSGYIRVNHEIAALFLDTAPVGPDYLPAHAHADTLSFELSFNEHRAIVNSGISCYGNSHKRLEQRGTAAHNTVIIDGKDSSEVWGGFRVARRARPIGREITQEKLLQVKCAHDGYKHLPGKPIHWRQWKFGDKTLVIRDCISGKFHRAVAKFHLHPDVNIVQLDLQNGVVHLSVQDIHFKMHVKDGDIKIHRGHWYPEFGLEIPANTISVEFKKSELETTIQWEK